MDPQKQFCPYPECPAYGKVESDTIIVHSSQDPRYRCLVCKRTFAATCTTPFYRLRTEQGAVTLALDLLSHGCPPQAIVAVFGFTERTVARWLERAGNHCQAVHEQVVAQGQVDLEHVQADELCVKMVKGRGWMAMAMAVPCRLWLGGVVSQVRDLGLITQLVQLVRACALSLSILVCVDGLSSYVTAFLRVFRVPVRTGGRGRPRLVLPEGLMMGQVINRVEKHHVVEVTRRVVRGTFEAIASVLRRTSTRTGINTAYIARLNATFRGALFMLVRRGRGIAHTEDVLTYGMYLVGCAYNFIWYHESLRMNRDVPGPSRRRWRERTPAMAAGLTDHPWTMNELLHYRVPYKAAVVSKRQSTSLMQPQQQQPRRAA